MRKFEILLIEAKYSESVWFSGEESLSLYVLAGFLKERFPEFEFNFTFGDSYNWDRVSKSQKYDFCGIYSPTQAWEEAIKVAKGLRKKVQIMAVGGPHISCMPESLTEEFDLGCVGKGEPLLEALFLSFPVHEERLEPEFLKTIPGAIYLNDGKLVINPRLCSKGSNDSIVSPYKYFLEPNPHRCRIISSVGCPHNCYFCAAKAINPNLKLRSAKDIAKEMIELYQSYGIVHFKFVDDNFLVSKKRVYELVRILKENAVLDKFSTSCDASSKLIDEETIALLKELRTESISFGFESGSEKILSKLKCGQISIKDHKRAIDLLIKNDIMVYGSFVLGTPGETENDLKKTLKFIKRNRINHLTVFLLKPLPGTPFWNDLVRSRKIFPEKIRFSELGFYDPQKHWYFNEATDFEVTIRYLKKLNLIGNFRTIRFHWKKAFFYRFFFNQISNLVKRIFQKQDH